MRTPMLTFGESDCATVAENEPSSVSIAVGVSCSSCDTRRYVTRDIASRYFRYSKIGSYFESLSPNFLAGKSQSAPLTSAEFEKRYKDIIAKEMK